MMAQLEISTVPMLQSTSRKSGNVSRNRRSGSIIHCVTCSSVYTTAFQCCAEDIPCSYAKRLFVGTCQGQKGSWEGKAGSASIQKEKSSTLPNLCCSWQSQENSTASSPNCRLWWFILWWWFIIFRFGLESHTCIVGTTWLTMHTCVLFHVMFNITVLFSNCFPAFYPYYILIYSFNGVWLCPA